jgi:glucose dehydrogenase
MARLRRFRVVPSLLLAVVVGAALASVGVDGQSRPSPGRNVGWTDYGGGPDSAKFADVDQITKANVSRLRVAWSYPTGDNAVYSFNPLVVDNVM